MNGPRFLLDDAFMAQLASVDSSFSEHSKDGRLAVYVDYRRGTPLSVEIIRVHDRQMGMVRLALQVSATDSA